jgi:hypothetical protein
MIEALTESPPGSKAYYEMGAKRRRSDWEHSIREGLRCGRRDEDAAGPIGPSRSARSRGNMLRLDGEYPDSQSSKSSSRAA